MTRHHHDYYNWLRSDNEKRCKMSRPNGCLLPCKSYTYELEKWKHSPFLYYFTVLLLLLYLFHSFLDPLTIYTLRISWVYVWVCVCVAIHRRANSLHILVVEPGMFCIIRILLRNEVFLFTSPTTTTTTTLCYGSVLFIHSFNEICERNEENRDEFFPTYTQKAHAAAAVEESWACPLIVVQSPSEILAISFFTTFWGFFSKPLFTSIRLSEKAPHSAKTHSGLLRSFPCFQVEQEARRLLGNGNERKIGKKMVKLCVWGLG